VSRGLRDGKDLGVGRWVLQDLPLIMGLPDDLAFVNNHASDGNFADLEGPFGLAERALHVASVVVKHRPTL